MPTIKKVLPFVFLLSLISAYPLYRYVTFDPCDAIGIVQVRDTISTNTSYDTSGNKTTDDTSSLEIVQTIRYYEANKKVKALVFVIDSHGGDGAAAQEVAYALRSAKKPRVALIRGTGDSAAYWIASEVGHIFALPISDVGGLGVTSSYTDNALQNKNAGQTFHQLSIGKYKDMYNQDKPLTKEEELYIMAKLKKSLGYFLQAVSNNRHIPLNKVEKLADGAAMTGEEALANGLIDEYGSFAEVEKYLSGLLGEKVRICM